MRLLLRYLAQGALIAMPIAITLYVIVALVSFVDGLLHFRIPGLGLVVTLALLVLLGFVASSVIGTRLVAFAEGLLGRLPLVKILYNDFAGNVVAVPRASITPLELKSSEFMSFVVSGGIAGLMPEGARRSRPG